MEVRILISNLILCLSISVFSQDTLWSIENENRKEYEHVLMLDFLSNVEKMNKVLDNDLNRIDSLFDNNLISERDFFPVATTLINLNREDAYAILLKYAYKFRRKRSTRPWEILAGEVFDLYYILRNLDSSTMTRLNNYIFYSDYLNQELSFAEIELVWLIAGNLSYEYHNEFSNEKFDSLKFKNFVRILKVSNNEK